MEEAAPQLRTLMSGIGLGESPRWHDGRLWFSDWVAGEVIAIDGAGTSDVMLRIDAFPFSIDWLPDGRLLVICAGGLMRQEPDGSLATHADLSGISPKPWNEIVVDGRGNVYVNNIGFDMMAGEQPGDGIITVVTPDGAARQVADGLAFPNGMAVTPDNGTLIVAESYGKRLSAFDIGADGGLSNRRVWADLGDGVPDGISIDAEGAVWYADVPNKRCVRVPEGGDVLQTVDVNRGCFACMLGGAGGSTLFIVAAEWNGPASIGAARTGLALAVDVRVAKAGWP